MTNIRITLAVGDYDRTRALGDGRVRPEGVDLTVLNLPVEEIFYRQLTYQEFDLSEMSFSSYVLSLQRPNPAFIAIPVFRPGTSVTSRCSSIATAASNRPPISGASGSARPSTR